jgi:hypothetical protein
MMKRFTSKIRNPGNQIFFRGGWGGQEKSERKRKPQMQRIQLTPVQRQAHCKPDGATPAAPRTSAQPTGAAKPSTMRAMVSSIKDAMLKGGRVVSIDTARIRAAALASKTTK